MKYWILFFLILINFRLQANDIKVIHVTEGKSIFAQFNTIGILEDQTNSLSFKQVRNLNFAPSKEEIPNLGLSKSTFWIKVYINNQTHFDHVLLRVSQPNLDEVIAYIPTEEGRFDKKQSGVNLDFNKREYKSQNILFELPIISKDTKAVFLKIKSKGPIQIPIHVGSEKSILGDITRDYLFFGTYLGGILIMFLYNFFIFLSIKDNDYLRYVVYILAVGLTQLSLKGFGYRFLWHDYQFISDQSVIWSGVFSAVVSILFVRAFLDTKTKLPIVDKILKVLIVIDLLAGGMSLLSLYQYSFMIVNSIALIGAIILMYCGIILSLRGYRPARFYLIAWSFFLFSVVIYALTLSGVLSFNLLTQNILLIGSGLELALLSFALADKINMYKKEKELSQAAALQSAREKEDYIREENIVLEKRVNERTVELQDANIELKQTLEKLKSAQVQLVEAEKMSSLGQLTAGIAHEINNPINFVLSSVKPLKLDIRDLWALQSKYDELGEDNTKEKMQEIKDYKEEIELPFLKKEIMELLRGIGEGATRTAEIVKELKNFSRLDEETIKEMCIPEAIDTTLTLLKHAIPENLTIIKDYKDKEVVECYPGKLNQVFMNILTNALQAIVSHESEEEGQLVITTEQQGPEYLISIRDNGPGIPAEVRDKIFEPFFTTKEVGEGTGLGLSIVYNIIEKHKGKIEIHSDKGKGTEFLITLPIRQPA